MENLKKIGLFFLIALCIMGMVAGPICLAVYNSWVPMIGSLAVDGIALKPLIDLIKKLID